MQTLVLCTLLSVMISVTSASGATLHLVDVDVDFPACISLSPSRLTPQRWEVASSAQGGRQGEHAPSVEKAV